MAEVSVYFDVCRKIRDKKDKIRIIRGHRVCVCLSDTTIFLVCPPHLSVSQSVHLIISLSVLCAVLESNFMHDFNLHVLKPIAWSFIFDVTLYVTEKN